MIFDSLVLSFVARLRKLFALQHFGASAYVRGSGVIKRRNEF